MISVRKNRVEDAAESLQKEQRVVDSHQALCAQLEQVHQSDARSFGLPVLINMSRIAKFLSLASSWFDIHYRALEW